MFAEVLALIPPEEDLSDEKDEAASSPDNEENHSHPRNTEHNAQNISSSLKSRSQDDTVDSTFPPGRSSTLPTHKLPATGSYNISPLDREFELSASGNLHGGFSVSDIDALLRF